MEKSEAEVADEVENRPRIDITGTIWLDWPDPSLTTPYTEVSLEHSIEFGSVECSVTIETCHRTNPRVVREALRTTIQGLIFLIENRFGHDLLGLDHSEGQ